MAAACRRRSKSAPDQQRQNHRHCLRFRSCTKKPYLLPSTSWAISRGVEAAQVQIDEEEEEEERQSKPHSIDMWGNVLLSPDNQVEVYDEELDAMKEEVRAMVVDKAAKPEDKMILIDTLTRLGVAYYFEEEIQDQIGSIFDYYFLPHRHHHHDLDLFTTALHFRLFRLHGFKVPSSVFEKFKNSDGTFKEGLGKDVEGLVSLYEATHVRFRQDHILEDARVFAIRHLKQALQQHGGGGNGGSWHPSLRDKVALALDKPTHRTLPRLETRHYIPIYDKQPSKNELLARFARLDFNSLQNLHKQEINQIIEWWKGLDIASWAKLGYFRDRPVEGYLWGAGNLVSRDSFSRMCGAKGLLLIILMNDTFDNYATADEAKKLHQMMRNPTWDISKLDNDEGLQLPDYMRATLRAIWSTFDDVDRVVKSEHVRRGYDAVEYGREAFRKLSDFYQKRNSWYVGEETPTFLKVTMDGLYDSGNHGTVAAYVMGMENANEDHFKWVMSGPPGLEATGLYTRYMNDFATYTVSEFEFEFGFEFEFEFEFEFGGAAGAQGGGAVHVDRLLHEGVSGDEGGGGGEAELAGGGRVDGDELGVDVSVEWGG
nr:terpene synthase 13 [Andrographis paniculata]